MLNSAEHEIYPAHNVKMPTIDNFSEIDDEQHLLLKCSRFSEIRIALFDHVRKSCPRIDTLNDENKFIYLLNSSGPTIKEVAKFLHSAYTARSA